MTMLRRRLGIRGENIAAEYLKRKGLQIIERNFKCRLGEIDIIAREGNYLVLWRCAPEAAHRAACPRKVLQLLK